jgi:CMP-N-acetylneuraminic acid synthetase
LDSVVKKPEILAVIPARGGSKSIPRKNIRSLAGHPLIAYSIAAGRASRTVTRLIVSTDDEEIAGIARQYGAEVPFLRPALYSQDQTLDLPVFQHALTWLMEQESYQPDIVVQLRPTSPFRRVQHIDDSVRLLQEHPQADAVRTVCVPFQNPFKMWRISPDGWMQPLGMELGVKVEPYNQPRQALPDVYWQTGYVDACRAATIREKNSMTGEHILPLVIDPADWIDIDSADDWLRAERLLENGEITLEKLGLNFNVYDGGFHA